MTEPIAPPTPLPRQTRTEKRLRCRILFREFFKIAAFVLGGGFAILLVADDVFVHKHKWIREGELSDMLALIQTVPGLTAGNIAIYVGYRAAGFAGAFWALFGVAAPSFLVITVIALCFTNLPLTHPVVHGAFIGVRTSMTALTLLALVNVWKSSVTTAIGFTVFVLCSLAVLLYHIGPGWLILGGLLFGLASCLFNTRDILRAEAHRPQP